jgi:hypothetical protein
LCVTSVSIDYANMLTEGRVARPQDLWLFHGTGDGEKCPVYPLILLRDYRGKAPSTQLKL